MDFIQDNLLTVTIFFPLLAGAYHFPAARRRERTYSAAGLGLSLVPLVLVMVMWFNYDRVRRPTMPV